MWTKMIYVLVQAHKLAMEPTTLPLFALESVSQRQRVQCKCESL